MHPGVIIFAWLGVVIALQVLDLLPLGGLLLAMPLVLSGAQRRRWWQLARRSRYLIVILVLTFLLSTPGEALWPGFAGSWEGLVAALAQAGRFLLILAAVAWLLETCQRDELMAGLYCLLRPLSRLGWRTERAVARLALVLAQVDSRVGTAGWRVLLDEAPAPDGTSVRLYIPDFGRGDVAITVLAVLLVVLAIVA